MVWDISSGIDTCYPLAVGLGKFYANTGGNDQYSANRDPGSGAFLTPGSGIRDGKKVSIRIRDEQPGSYFLELRNHFFGFLGVKILKFFDADPGSGMETVQIREMEWKKVGSGINIPDPQLCSYQTWLLFRWWTWTTTRRCPSRVSTPPSTCATPATRPPQLHPSQGYSPTQTG